MPPSLLFQQYAQQLDSRCSALSRTLRDAATSPSPSSVQEELKQLDVLLKSLDLEARSHAAAETPALLAKVEAFRGRLKSLREEAASARAAAAGASSAAARAELGLGPEGASSSSAMQRQRAVSATEQLLRSKQQLENAKSTLAQAQDSGAATLAELQRQREVLQHAKHNLDATNDRLDEAGGSLKTMLKRSRWYGFLY